MAGLVPATPLNMARQCPVIGVVGGKPGDDKDKFNSSEHALNSARCHRRHPHLITSHSTLPPPDRWPACACSTCRGSSPATCSRLQLADFGADVIKVEPPAGDPLRDWRDDGQELHWKTYARNKRSIVLNLRHDGAKDALLRLVADADVLIENFRPGTLEEMGLGPDVLLARQIPDSSSCASPASARPAPTRSCPVSARWSRR